MDILYRRFKHDGVELQIAMPAEGKAEKSQLYLHFAGLSQTNHGSSATACIPGDYEFDSLFHCLYQAIVR